MANELQDRLAIERNALGDRSWHLEKLSDIFGRMDNAYHEAAEKYGFECHGCDENCCYSEFYHHTLLEYLYLYKGFLSLSTASRERILKNAKTNLGALAALGLGEKLPEKQLCPLNIDTQCLLYAYRPMICRLHGIPHELQIGPNETQTSPGCGAFTRQFVEASYVTFDRTPFYQQMVAAEQSLRQETRFSHRIKMTVAEMLLSYTSIGPDHRHP